MISRFVLPLLAGLMAWPSLHAQKVIVALGSSTTMGAAATSNDSAWVGRLQSSYRKNTSPFDPDTIIYKLGGYGYTTYHVMPTGWVSPIANRPAIDQANNITAAMNYHPDAVIINLPSNDVASLSQPWVTPTYSLKETMDNFRILYQFVVSSGARCFITTSQPRNDLTTDQRQMQQQLVDSIQNNFGSYHINFWEDLVSNDGSLSLRDEVRHLGYADSQFHLNNYGHLLLFEKSKARDFFPLNAPLPLRLTGFSAINQNNSVHIKWETADEQAHTVFEIQRSTDSRGYTGIYIQNGQGNSNVYKWTDQQPPAGTSYYRLQVKEPGKTWYSNVIPINNKKKELALVRLRVEASMLVADLDCLKKGPVTVRITNMQGSVLQENSIILNQPRTTIRLPLQKFPSGEYVLSIIPSSGEQLVQRFVKAN